MSKLMHLLIMYHQIHRLHRAGFSVSWISREVVLNRRTVKKYLAMSEDEYLDFIDNQLSRQRKKAKRSRKFNATYLLETLTMRSL